MSSIIMAARPVVKRVVARPANEAFGDLVLTRSLGGHELRNLDPFLMLDDGTSETGKWIGPDHPHRGFETVSYTIEGGQVHEDFAGHKGIVDTGDFQVMNAGRGIVHSAIGTQAGRMRGLQLWINLSSKNRMDEPSHVELKSKDIPEVEKDGIKVRVISGDAFGILSPSYTRSTPTMFLDFTLNPGAHLQQPIPSSWNAFAYILEGEGIFGNSKNSPTKSYNLLVLGSGDGLEAWNPSSIPLKFMLIAGKPIGEPVVQHGPFVMSTNAEIEQTFRDYRSYKNGFEKARNWVSEAVRRQG